MRRPTDVQFAVLASPITFHTIAFTVYSVVHFRWDVIPAMALYCLLAYLIFKTYRRAGRYGDIQ